MANTLVALIETLRIDTIELPHAVGEMAIGVFPGPDDHGYP
jgi:hypothetical protein